MRRLRFAADLKSAHGVLKHAMCIRCPLMLSQMLEPRIGQEGLDEAPWSAGILEHAPIARTVTPALTPVSFFRRQERVAIRRVDGGTRL
jgi:hypothetical protein